MDGWRVLTCDADDLAIWETLVHKVSHEQHVRDKSMAQMTANAVWSGIKS